MGMGSGKAQARMVAEQLRKRGIKDERVLRAMRQVPRAFFVPAEDQALAYGDHPLPIPAGQTISQPYVVAYMLAALRLKPTDKALEIGAGSGYVLALLSRLVAAVYGIERQAALGPYAQVRLDRLGCGNVRLRAGDGTTGWARHAPYDAILVSAGGPHVPAALKAQLAPGGRLVMPVGADPHQQVLLRLVRRGPSEYDREQLSAVAFVPLVGADAWTEDAAGMTKDGA